MIVPGPQSRAEVGQEVGRAEVSRPFADGVAAQHRLVVPVCCRRRTVSVSRRRACRRRPSAEAAHARPAGRHSDGRDGDPRRETLGARNARIGLSSRSRGRGGRGCAARRCGRAGAVLAVERPAGRLDADEPERLGRERQRLVACTKSVDVRYAAAAVEEVEHHLGAEAGRRHAEPGVADGVARPGPDIAVPQNTQNRLHVSMAPPQMWLKRDALELREGGEEVLAQRGPRLGPALQLRATLPPPVVDGVVAAPQDPVVLGQPVVVELVGGCRTGPGGCASRSTSAARASAARSPCSSRRPGTM